VVHPGNAHASWEAVDEVTSIVTALRARWPGVTLALRADGGVAVPTLRADGGVAVPARDDCCAAERIEYAIGLLPNPRLEDLAAPLLALATAPYAHTQQWVRLIGQTRYQAESWHHPRRVVIKAEVSEHGASTRFVVTSRQDAPVQHYACYIERGAPETWVTDFKRACAADRWCLESACCRFWANPFRLLLHAASWLLDTFSRWLSQRGVARMQVDTLQLRHIKIGGWVRWLADRVRLHLVSVIPLNRSGSCSPPGQGVRESSGLARRPIQGRAINLPARRR
jgi:hypothetical protein